MSISFKVIYKSKEKTMNFSDDSSLDEIQTYMELIFGLPNGKIYFEDEELGVLPLSLLPKILRNISNRTLYLFVQSPKNMSDNMNITNNGEEVNNPERSPFRYASKSFDSTREKFKQYPKVDDLKLSKVSNPENSTKSKKKEKLEKDTSVNISLCRRIKGKKGPISPKKFIRIDKSTTFVELKEKVASKFDYVKEPDSMHIYSVKGVELDEDTWNPSDYMKGNFQFLFDGGKVNMCLINFNIDEVTESISNIDVTTEEKKEEKKRKMWREVKQRQRANKKKVN